MNIFILIAVVLVVGGIVFPLITYLRAAKKEDDKVNKLQNNTTLTEEFKDKVPKDVNVGATQDVLDFDNVVYCNDDAGLLKVGENSYLGYLQIQGVPFNLLSAEERLELEENYGNLLNGIDFPFQSFVQSKTLPLDHYADMYTEKVNALKKKLNTAESKLNGTLEGTEERRKAEILVDKLKNQWEYGCNLLKDFINKNIDYRLLKRNYYVVIKYVYEKIDDEELTDFEILEHAFNDITNKANLFSDTLDRNGLSCKFLNAMEIMDLLYNSYNKEDAPNLKLKNAIKARYNHLVTTSKPIIAKKIDLEIKKTKEEQEKLAKGIKDNYTNLEKIIEKHNSKDSKEENTKVDVTKEDTSATINLDLQDTMDQKEGEN